MASSAVTGTASTKPAQAETAPKKTRKNPARRKAERANTNSNVPKNPPSSLKNEPTLPTPLSRQASAPSVVNNVNASRPPLKNRKSTTAAATPESKASNTQQSKETSTQPKASTVALATSTSRPTPRRSASTPATFNTPALVTGGLIGCAAGAAILMAVHVWYDFAGLKAAVATARAARLCVDNLSEELITSLDAGTYSTNEALDMLRRATLAYASTIRDGAPVVERVFREIEAVRQSRGAEVDQVLAGAYEELRAAGDKGLSARETRNIVLRHLLRLSLFASRATQDVLTRNPRLKPYRDGAIRALKEPPREKVPTTKVNLVVKHKQSKR